MTPRTILCLALLTSTGALAQRAEAQPKTAVEYFEIAQKQFDDGHYLKAAKAYEAAYAAAPDKHALLYNIGLAYHRAGRVKEALQNYEDYLRLDPKGAAVDEVREYVAQFRELLGKSGETDTGTKEPEPPVESTAPDGATPTPPTTTPVPGPPPPPKRPSPPLSKTQKKGLLIGGGGLVLLAGSIATGVMAGNAEADVEARYNSGNSFPDGTHLKGQILDGVTIGMSVVGGAALLTGVAMYYWGRPGDEAPPAGVTLTPFTDGRHTVGVGATTSF